MKHQEKKFLVDSFGSIEKLLNQAQAKKCTAVVSAHYYGNSKNKDVTKLVDYGDRCEVHILSESDGKFILTERMPIESLPAGLLWLKNKGFSSYTKVKMQYIDYEYMVGIVGLYIINDSLHSVILDFPADKHNEMERRFGLEGAKQIITPYNKLLEDLGEIEPTPL